MPDFFTTLGQRVAAELSRPSGKYQMSPQTRAHLASVMGVTLDQHLSRPPVTAKDQALAQRPVPRGPRYNQMPSNALGGLDQEAGEAPISGEDCLEFVKLCAARLSDQDRETFLMGLADMLSTEYGAQDDGNGVRPNNQGALDRVRGGSRSGRTRQPAQDSAIRLLNSSSFHKRWGGLVDHVTLNGAGRR